MNVRDAFYEVLRTQGITTIFGPGSSELPLLRDFPSDFRYVRALPEGAAIGMADGYAQATGRPALVNLPAADGPGNALGNLANAQCGHVPLIVVKWSHEPARPRDIPQTLSRGIFLARTAPAGPVCLSLPLDGWDQAADLSALGRLRSRTVDGHPIVPAPALARLRDRLAAARNPVLIAGPAIDNQAGWDDAVRLADKLALPVLAAPGPSRCPFPTRHPGFRGILPASIPALARELDGHDLVVVFGAASLRCHEFPEGGCLPPDCELWAVTADPDEASRAPFGQILVGDPSDALTRLAGALPAGRRPPRPPRASLPPADAAGPAFTAEAIIDALNAATTDSTVIVPEWTPAETRWDRFEFTRPGSLHFPAGGRPGWGLPAAIGLQLGDPARRVLCLLGDDALQPAVSGLWTAARYNIPVVFVVARSAEYADVTALAAAYGIASQRAGRLSELTRLVEEALAGDQPRLIEIDERLGLVETFQLGSRRQANPSLT